MSTSSRSHGRLLSIIAALGITIGFWFGPEIYRDLSRDAFPAARESKPETGIAQIDRESESVLPAANGRMEKPQGGRAVYQEDPVEMLARLRQTCEFWTARANDERGRLYRDRACREMRAYAAGTRQASPTVRSRPLPATPPSASTPGSSAGVYVRECTNHRYGSIDYRRCRAQESERLKNLCQHYRQRDQWQSAAQWCAMYESYGIVD